MMLVHVKRGARMWLIEDFPSRNTTIQHFPVYMGEKRLGPGEEEAWFRAQRGSNSPGERDDSLNVGERIPKPAEWDAWLEKRRVAGGSV